MEGFRAQQYDFRQEYSAARWATDYNFPAVENGKVRLEQLEHGRPSGMLGLVFNTRREIFRDRSVRRALSLAFDFDRINRMFFHNAYVRTKSIWDNSDLASYGTPSGLELALLEPFKNQLPSEVFRVPYSPPKIEGDIRANLKAAKEMLHESGWSVRNGALMHIADKLPMTFEILLVLSLIHISEPTRPY